MFADTGEDFHLLEYWRILVERRLIVVACVGVFLAVGILVSFLATPRYRATATLQIERHGPDVLTFQEIVGVDPAGYYDFYETQYRIIQSQAVLRLAAERIDLANRPDLIARKGTPIGRLSRWVRSLLASPAEEPEPMARAIGFVAAGLGVQPVRNSQLVEVSFTDRDSALASDVANAVADAYLRFSRESRYSTTEEASEFLTKQVARQQSEIAALERQLQEYGAQNELVGLRDGAQDISEQALGELNNRLSQARARLAGALARYESVREATPDSLPEVYNSPLINRLKQDQAEIERRYAQLAEKFKPNWPPLEELRQELSQSEASLQAETDAIVINVRESARSEMAQAQGEVNHLQNQVDRQMRQVQRVNRDAIEYSSLRSEIATRRQVLSDLVARQSQTETSEQLLDTSASNIRVVDRAVPSARPIRPRKVFNLFVALVLGSVTGVGMAFVMHYVDNTLKSEADIARYAPGVSLLGHVPLLNRQRLVAARSSASTEGPSLATAPSADFFCHRQPRSDFAEALKNLRTSLLLASPEHPPRRIAITSAEPGDGKSTIAINLATVLAQMGRRVLLVDADLRRPRVHRAFGMTTREGLSTVLSGNAGAVEVIQGTEIPDLFVLTSGPIPPNPSELLDSPSLGDLLQCLDARNYDHIILDCPPVAQIADTLILSSHVHALVVVVRAGLTTRESLMRGLARLRQARRYPTGIVLNAVPERSRYYYSHRHYTHVYGETDPSTSERSDRPLRASRS